MRLAIARVIIYPRLSLLHTLLWHTRFCFRRPYIYSLQIYHRIPVLSQHLRTDAYVPMLFMPFPSFRPRRIEQVYRTNPVSIYDTDVVSCANLVCYY